MKNWLGDGDSFEFTGIVKTVGAGILQGSMFGVVTKGTPTTSDVGVAKRFGRVKLAKLSTDNMSTVGAKSYWDAANNRMQLTQIPGAFAAYVAKVAAGGTTETEFILAGGAADV